MSDLYQTALRAHQEGDLDLAEKLYCDILKNNPQNHDVLHLMGILLAERQDFLKAFWFIERALAIVTDSPSFHNSMGNVLRNLRRHEEAIVHYKIALQHNPSSAVAHNNLGNVFFSLEKIEEAKEQYNEAIRLLPNYADAYYNLSLVLIRQNLLLDARKNLELVLQLQSDHGLAHANLAYLLQTEGEFDQAMTHYEKAIEVSGGSVLSCHNLGVILTNKGKYDDAVRQFKKVLELNPENIETLNNLGAVFLLQKKPREALPYFLELTKKIVDFDVCYNLGVIYQGLGSLDESIVYFRKALEVSPHDIATRVNLGAIYLQLRDYPQAEKYYLQASHLQPDNEEIRYILAAIGQKNDELKAPVQYVKNLFDQYASYFDKHLEMLEHRTPQLIYDAVQARFDKAEHSLVVLDLGCGTGMSGVRFKSLAKRLIGIDLSAKMLEIARSKNIYTDLKLAAIEDAILEFSNVDLVIASDSLVYFGELNEIFAKCYQVLTVGGIFGFTVEVSEDVYPYVLQRSARFAHSRKYIKEVAAKNNFIVLQSDTAVLRKHGDVLIKGDLFVLCKP